VGLDPSVPRPAKALRALVLGCLLTTLPLADAGAQEAPENGVIAFSAQRAGKRVIYTRQSNGTRLRLAPTGVGSDDPAFSPRGRRLAFTRRGPGGAQVWITYLDGNGLRQLTAGPSDGMAQWSPTGGTVVFARGTRGRRDLYRIEADGSGQTRLTFSRRDDHSPSWSVKDEIAFVRTSRGKSHVYVMPAGGGTPRRLTRDKPDDTTPSWSPTGRTLVVARGRAGRRDLYLITADGSHARRLTKVPGDESEPAFSPDRTRIVFTYRRRGKRRVYVMKVKGKPIRRLPATRSLRARRLTTTRSQARLASWQPTGLAPVVAAAGDIACDPESPSFNDGLGIPGSCRQKLTSDLLLRADLSRILALGDDQYEDAQLWKFQRSFDPSWGRLKPLISSVPGNHEYRITDAAGYFDYFNGAGNQSGPAGDRSGGYYSFEVGTWHVIALNSECRHIGGCGVDSPQMRWLAADLRSHAATACTAAFWHRPHFTSGGHDDNGDMLPAWSLLYDTNADVILTGHDHTYERFAPQTPAGTADSGRGIRQFVAGMGGKSHFGFPDIQPNSEFRSNGFYGVLELTLKPGGYDWRAVRALTGGTVDSGSANCH
jgi:acid phosphatase type 7